MLFYLHNNKLIHNNDSLEIGNLSHECEKKYKYCNNFHFIIKSFFKADNRINGLKCGNCIGEKEFKN